MSNTNVSLVSSSIRHHLVMAGIAVAVLVLGAGGWAYTTNISGAVVASGTFVVDSHVKKVQHLSGGVVGEILVHEGQKVAAGETLLRLDATQTQAGLAIVTKRLDELAARGVRLVAERDDEQTFSFPLSLMARKDNPETAKLMAGENSLFAFRKASRLGKKAQLRERVLQSEKEVKGLVAQQEAKIREIALIKEELDGLRKLWKKRLVSQQRLMTMERSAVKLDGESGYLLAQQAQAAGRIAETELQIIQVDQDLKSEVATELRDIQVQTGEYVERKVAALNELKHIDIIAPLAGVVHQLTVHTVGGVISPADVIMLIVPDNDKLALEAQISPQDIDQIQLGQKVTLRMSAFNQRTTPELNGEISRIAADLTQNQQTGNSYYLVRITVSGEELSRLGKLTLVPGMPAEAFIKTGERTVLSYLIKPLGDNISRAFREE